MSLTLLIGGARSGKSALAVELGRRHERNGGAVTFVATAPVTDADMEDRIERHRAERPPTWRTIEEQHDLAGTVARIPDPELVIVDCLTLWTSNMMWIDAAEGEIMRRVHDLVAACTGREGRVVVITNEVGLGVHPEHELGRRYRDLLGRVNTTVAMAADPALLLVAGRAVELSDPWQTLDR